MFGKEFSKLILHVYICKYLLYVVRYVRILFCRVLSASYQYFVFQWALQRGTVARYCSNGQITVPTGNSLFKQADYCSNGQFTVPTGFLLLLAINRFSQVLRTHTLEHLVITFTLFLFFYTRLFSCKLQYPNQVQPFREFARTPLSFIL